VSNEESPDSVGIQFTRAGGETDSLAQSAGMGSEFGYAVGEMEMAGGEMGMGAALAHSTPAKKFPSLDDQKLADLAWKWSGLELESIGEMDLKRVQTLGYDGGVKVTDIAGNPGGILPDDVLVGLHAWPTRNVKDVLDVLNRDDLAELNPLKYYVIRQHEDQGGFSGGSPAPAQDEVVTGRITVNVPARNTAARVSSTPGTSTPVEMLRAIRSPASVSKPKPTPLRDDANERRYDAKTYSEWNREWWDSVKDAPAQREQRQLDALQAFVAFADAGYGQKATGMIAEASLANDGFVEKHARDFLRKMPAEERVALVMYLVGELDHDLSRSRRIAAMRALAAIGPPAKPALVVLKKALPSRNRYEQIAAAAAIKMIVGIDQYQKPVADVLGEELGITVAESNGVWVALPRDDAKDDGKAFNDFTEAVIKEQQQLFPDGKF
jgi:hypothetical protein